MPRTIYINFSDLNQETQDEILALAEEEIRNDKGEMREIKDMYPDKVDGVIRERAEWKLYQFNYVFNV